MQPGISLPATGVSRGEAFALDTSGAVEVRRDLLANGVPAEPDRVTWPDLSPFEQGYVEAMLAAARSALHCGYIAGRDRIRYPADHPRAFSDLAPETLAAIRKDCAEVNEGDARGPLNAVAGGLFWKHRQIGDFAKAGFPPLTVTIGDDGKVRFQ